MSHRRLAILTNYQASLPVLPDLPARVSLQSLAAEAEIIELEVRTEQLRDELRAQSTPHDRAASAHATTVFRLQECVAANREADRTVDADALSRVREDSIALRRKQLDERHATLRDAKRFKF